MTRLLMIAASAALFATGASAQMAPGSWEPSAENCKKPQYSATDACKNFVEGRSSSTKKPADTTIDSGNSPAHSGGGNRSGSGASSPSGSGPGGAN
jgi:hypothetical protein